MTALNVQLLTISSKIESFLPNLNQRQPPKSRLPGLSMELFLYVMKPLCGFNRMRNKWCV